jgi:TRAP-type C4-dicarboxylate transport system permease small subunit
MSLLRKVRHIFLIIVSCFFLLFGVHVLIAAYQLTDPFSFVMTFFASNLIILISAALTLGFAVRLFRSDRKEEIPQEKTVGEE